MPGESYADDSRRDDRGDDCRDCGERERRRYEEAVLAALDFEPRTRPARRGLSPAYRLALLGALHVVFAVALAEGLAADTGGLSLALAAAGWLICTALIARAIFRAGTRLRRLTA